MPASGIIFSGNDVKTLKSNIDLNGNSKILSGSTDPSSIATNAPKGSLYLNTSNSNLYKKTDNGSTTNWVLVDTNFTTGDITESNATIANNQVAAANVTGLSFSTTTVRAARIFYSVYRTTNSAELSETGELYVNYKNTAGTWAIANDFFGDDSGVTFSITNAGQVQYTSSNVAGTGYTGVIHFRADVTLQ